MIEFDVVFSCQVCCPVEGMKINCIVKNVTKAGLKCEIDDKINPLIIFIARDHSFLDSTFTSLKEEDEIQVKILGIRYELNDKFISVIAKLLNKL